MNTKNLLPILFMLLIISTTNGQQVKKSPSFEEVISLKTAGYVAISPNGENVAFALQSTDWKNNRFDTEIWLSKAGLPPVQMTRNVENSSFSPVFSPDDKWLAFLSDRGAQTQIFVMRLAGGEPFAVTEEEEGISDFAWHPDGQRFLFTKNDKEDSKKKSITKRYGSFEIDDAEFTRSHLWEIVFDPNIWDQNELPCYEKSDSLKAAAGCLVFPKAKQLTQGDFTVNSFKLSPDGKMVAYSHQPDPLISSMTKSDISILDLQTGNSTLFVDNKSSDMLQDWSPDAKQILFTSFVDDTVSNFYKNAKIFTKHILSGESRQLGAQLDENPGQLIWTSKGIYGAFYNKTNRPIYRIEPKDGTFKRLDGLPEQISAVTFSKNGDKMALNARNGNQLNEIWLGNVQPLSAKKITTWTDQIKDWNVADSEVILWRSKDGTLVEGVLHKPQDYDPNKKYPLLVVIHGGPTGIDTPSPVPAYVYPIVQWLNKGALVLRPNYRGSAGYGEEFRSLNVENLGVGDAWDVMGGVDFLSAKGMIDTERMGVMGWSQGGYISAFLTTNTNRFKAISVGAGISNWMTYYVNTDIHPFTIQYLKANPWDNEEIYRMTSPMTNIKNAQTPTLIQHGENDRRVPIPNAYELLQGLRDQGVPSELVVYKGFGHGITKPKERLAATWHNWQWFARYIWNEEIELPVEDN